MSNLEQFGRRAPGMVYSDNADYAREAEPRRSSATAWMVGGLVAIVAIVAVAVMIVNTNNVAANNVIAAQGAAYQQGVAQTQASDAQSSAMAAQQQAAEARNSAAIAEARATQSAPPLSPATMPAQDRPAANTDQAPADNAQ